MADDFNPDTEEITPFQLTEKGEALLTGAQTLRRALANYARSERDGITLMRAPDPSVVKAVSQMSASGFDVALADDLLDELEMISERGCHVFELHFFAGVPISEIAQALSIPPRIAQRDWSVAKAWLYEKLNRPKPGDPLDSDE
jgi:hypothetical protein